MKSVRRCLYYTFWLVGILLFLTGCNYADKISDQDQNFNKTSVIWFNESMVNLSSWQNMSIDEILDEIDNSGIMFTKLDYLEDANGLLDGSKHSRTDIEVVKNTFHSNKSGSIQISLGKNEEDYRTSILHYNYDDKRLIFKFTEKKEIDNKRYRIGEQALTCSELIDIGMDRIPKETGLFQQHNGANDTISLNTKSLKLSNENQCMLVECIVGTESVRYEFVWNDKKLY